MTREFAAVHPDALIDEIADRIQSSGTEPIPVCENQRLIGMLTPQDVAPHVEPGRQGRPRIRVRDVMAPEILFCLEATEVEEAAALMNENRVRRLPVLNADRKLVGLLELDDIPSTSGPRSDDIAASGLEIG